MRKHVIGILLGFPLVAGCVAHKGAAQQEVDAGERHVRFSKPTIRVSAEEPVEAVLLQTQWVHLERYPMLRFRDAWAVYADADAQRLFDGLRMAGLVKADAPAKLKATRETPAVVTFSDWKDTPNDPISSVTVSVGGVPQEFRARNVGVEVELRLEECTSNLVKILGVVKRTRFLGFREYGGTTIDRKNGENTSQVKVPNGFYQPIFDTDERQYPVTLKPGERAVLQVEWPPATAEELKKFEIDVSPSAVEFTGRAFQGAKSGPEPTALLVIGWGEKAP